MKMQTQTFDFDHVNEFSCDNYTQNIPFDLCNGVLLQHCQPPYVIPYIQTVACEIKNQKIKYKKVFGNPLNNTSFYRQFNARICPN